MKRFVRIALILSCSAASIEVRADSCKPDISRVDKITKQQNEIWVQRVSATGLGASLMGSTDEAISVTAGRYGSLNAVNVEILKEEASAASATFDSSLHAVRGNRFFFGFKYGGEPLSFTATDVGNETKVRDDVLDFGKGKVVTSVVLSSAVSDDTLASMRTALTTKQIDAIRVILVGGLTIEKSIDDKIGKKLLEKFSCFFQSLDKRGLSNSAGNQQTAAQLPQKNDAARMAAVQGRYVRRGKATDLFELGRDGTAAVLQDGHILHGNYSVQGDTISFTSPEIPGQTIKGLLAGDTFKDDEGIVWEKLTEAQRAAAPPFPKEPPATASHDSTPSVDGTYTLRNGTVSMDFRADGSVTFHMGGAPVVGTYKTKGDRILLKHPKWSTTMLLVGNTIVGKTQVFDKQIEAAKTEVPKAATAPVTLRLGMTPEQVEAAQGGKPPKVIDLGSKKIYVYSDMKVTFVDGKVTDVQ